MTTFESVVFALGVFFGALLLLFIGIPVLIGSAQWWMTYAKKIKEVRESKTKEKQNV